MAEVDIAAFGGVLAQLGLAGFLLKVLLDRDNADRAERGKREELDREERRERVETDKAQIVAFTSLTEAVRHLTEKTAP
ncbi:MAG TPA: hypothetical protein VGB70_12690 [Allosphingosinicella sp.]|jgi:hypothetical protein